MVYQRYGTAVREGYSDRPDSELIREAAGARHCREWLESLAIGAAVRSELVEQIRVLEQAFGELLRERSHDRG